MADILKIKDGQGNWQTIAAIKGDKGDTGETGPQGPQGPMPTIAQSTGQSTTTVMSQKAVSDYIPTQASASNQLADKNFVNSSVQTATANFRGNWANWASVPTNSSQYPVDYAGSHTPTVNDYLVVQDASSYTEETLAGTWRFKYSGVWETVGKSGWKPEYQVNETPMTAAQLAALNSGITSALTTKLQGIPALGTLATKNSISTSDIGNAAVTADKIKTATSGAQWDSVVDVGADGVSELGKYLDFHDTNGATTDYDTRIVSKSGRLYYQSDSSENNRLVSKSDLLNFIYPVGSIYMSVTNTSPQSFLGGTWQAWGAGRVLVGVDTNQTEFNSVEKTGGEKTHTLTESEMPSHKHFTSNYNGGGKTQANATTNAPIHGDQNYWNFNNPGNSSYTGGNGAHNNLQPYITCYMWKRTA